MLARAVAACAIFLAGCAGDPLVVNCPDIARHAVRAAVRDSITEQHIPDAEGWLLDDGYAERMMQLAERYIGGRGRPGNYVVVFTRSGYVPWTTNIAVASDHCGQPVTVELTAHLRPDTGLEGDSGLVPIKPAAAPPR